MQTRFHAACAVARKPAFWPSAAFLDRRLLHNRLPRDRRISSPSRRRGRRLIQSRLIEAFAGDGFIGEEGGGLVGSPGAPIWWSIPSTARRISRAAPPHWCVLDRLYLASRSRSASSTIRCSTSFFARGAGRGPGSTAAPMRTAGNRRPRQSDDRGRLEHAARAWPHSMAFARARRRDGRGASCAPARDALAWLCRRRPARRLVENHIKFPGCLAAICW